MQFLRCLLSVLVGSMSAAALAQPYPCKAVRVMVGASPGGGTDIIARMLADKFAERLKQPFIVENRPGASNTIAADVAAKAAPDGYTLLVATNTAQAIAPHLIKLGFDPLKDVQPVGLIVVVPNVLVVGPTVPARSLQELLALVKSRPGRIPLRHRRRRQHPAHRGGSFCESDWNAAGACALQGKQPGARRSHRRSGGNDVRYQLVGDGTDQGGKAAAARGDHTEALGRAAERADARRSRRAGRRDEHLVRPVYHRR